MSALQTTMRFVLVVFFAGAIVLIGAEELRRRSKHTPNSPAIQEEMRKVFKPDEGFHEKLASKVKAKEEGEEEEAKAQLGSQMTPEEKEQADPTGIRSLVNKLIK